MKERMTIEKLNRLAARIEVTLGLPVSVDSDGSAKYSLVTTEGNRNGYRRLVGYLSKRELYDQMHAFLAGVEEAHRVYAEARK